MFIIFIKKVKSHSMVLFLFFLFINLNIGISLAANLSDSERGTLRGTVSTPRRIKPNQTVVYIMSHNFTEKFIPPAEPKVMDQHGKAFHPYVLPVLMGTTVVFPNNDPFFHNVFSPSTYVTKLNFGAYPPGSKKSKTFNNPGTAILQCNIHDFMEGYILILRNPFFVVPEKKGKYEIHNIPPGEYQVKIWSKKYRVPTKTVVIKANEITNKNFILK